VVYVCWDVLYVGDTSVTARPLTERQALLRGVVKEAPEAGVPIGEHIWYIGCGKGFTTSLTSARLQSCRTRGACSEPVTPVVLATGRRLVTGRIALLLPDQEQFLGGPPASRLCTTVEEIGDHLENALRLQVLGPGLRVQLHSSEAWLRHVPTV
jgi:hypothetical protein